MIVKFCKATEYKISLGFHDIILINQGEGMYKEWIIKDCDINDGSLIKRLLATRGIKNEQDIENFLNPLQTKLSDPYVFTDMQKCIERLSNAIDNNEKIIIYGDFDADGVTSTSLLYRTLSHLGADVNYFIPDREKEGHGLDTKALVKIMTTVKPKVLITVDCGISNNEAVSFLNSFKIDVIITDHHEAPEELPNAYAIINPKAPNAIDESLSAKEIESLTSLAGVGVAFKTAQALLAHYNKTEFIFDILPYAAVGTIADVVPLIGENRHIVLKGLDLISKGRHLGIKRLLESAGYTLSNGITSEQIAFGVAPRINASGRLDTVEAALKVMLSDNPQEIEMAVITLNEFNKIRQNLCQETFLQADEMIKKEGNKNPAIILFNPEWKVGIIGIVASKLVEKYYKPTFLMTYYEEAKQIRCSARSIEGIHLYDAIDSIGDLLDGYGGHAMAAGLSFSPDKTPFKLVKENLNRIIKEMTNGKDLKPFINIDLEVTAEDITVDLVEQISQLEPFGQANPSPVFAMKNLKIKQKRLMGENKDHLRLTVNSGNSEFNCIRWGEGDISLVAGDPLDVAFHPQINEYQGNITVQLIVDDIHSPHLKEEESQAQSQNSLKIYDHRKKTDILPQVNDYIKTTKQDILVFAESKAIKDKLRPYLSLTEKCVSRENLRICDSIMFFDYPADIETFQKILEKTSPKSIHLMNYEIKYFDEIEFLKTFAGMLKFAVNNNNGNVQILRFASHLGKSLNLIELMFDLFEEENFIKILEKDNKHFKIEYFGISDIEKLIQNPKYSTILNMAEECEIFQKRLMEDDLFEIENFISENEIQDIGMLQTV